MKGAKKLPLNLLDALRALGRVGSAQEALGEFVPSYLKLKQRNGTAIAAI